MIRLRYLVWLALLISSPAFSQEKPLEIPESKAAEPISESKPISESNPTSPPEAAKFLPVKVASLTEQVTSPLVFHLSSSTAEVSAMHIAGGGSLSVIADDKILFQKGFHVEKGGSFHATIRNKSTGKGNAVTASAETKDANLPTTFALAQNYPNPFNPSTVINYQLPVISDVRLDLFDVLGRRIATLVSARQAAGVYSFTFSTQNYALASGVYFYKLQAGTFTLTKKMMLVK
jgi:hypothetical protein